MNAAECAVAIQRTMAERNADVEEARRMRFRIGINQGDVVFDDARVYGDGVNVAARLENLAEPGGICISRKVYEDISRKMQLAFVDLGEQQLKNIAQPVRVYRVSGEQLAAARATAKPALALPDKPSTAVLPFTNLSGDAEQEYFADGMVEDIIAGLSRFHWLFVIARNSSFTYKGEDNLPWLFVSERGRHSSPARPSIISCGSRLAPHAPALLRLLPGRRALI